MRTLLLGAVLALASAGGCSNDKSGSSSTAAQKAEDNVPTMTVDAVDKLIAANEATAIDCNGDRTRKKLGVLPGAVLISDEESYPASELPADKARQLVFYCSDPR